jgi:hypothetical protein
MCLLGASRWHSWRASIEQRFIPPRSQQGSLDQARPPHEWWSNSNRAVEQLSIGCGKPLMDSVSEIPCGALVRPNAAGARAGLWQRRDGWLPSSSQLGPSKPYARGVAARPLRSSTVAACMPWILVKNCSSASAVRSCRARCSSSVTIGIWALMSARSFACLHYGPVSSCEERSPKPSTS